MSDTYPLVFKRKSADSELICIFNPSENTYKLDNPEGLVLASNNATVNDSEIVMNAASFVWVKK